MAYDYGRARAKLCRSLADHAHDKALEALHPHTAARWIRLMDALFWAAAADGELLLDDLCKDPQP